MAAYFAIRPRGSQLGAWASHQSRPVAGRDELEAAYDEMAARYPEPQPVPVPEEWGGYVIRPEVVEFWQAAPAACTTVSSTPAPPTAGPPSGWPPSGVVPDAKRLKTAF